MSGKDETPKSFDPAEWGEIVRRGGYYSEMLGEWVSVRQIEEHEISRPPSWALDPRKRQ